MTDTRLPLRIGNDERAAAITALDEHLRAGRIDHEEYGERMAVASMAKTREQLDELFADLPQLYPFPPSWPVGGAAYGAPVRPGGLPASGAGVWYDPDSTLWLPQGTQLASVRRRIGAFFLAMVLFVVTLGVGYLVWGVLVWKRGQTPALQVLGMRAYRPSTGRVAGFWWMVLREMVGRLVEQVGGILLELTSFLLFVSTKQRRSLHDLIAGTVVLYDRGRT